MKKRTKASAKSRMFQPDEYVRIVPLHHPKPSIAIGAWQAHREDKGADLFDGGPHAAPVSAHLTYRKGPLIPNVQVFTIWRKLWGQDDGFDNHDAKAQSVLWRHPDQPID